LAIWLWFTVALREFRRAVAEGRGKTADALRKARKDTIARRLRNGVRKSSAPNSKSDLVVCEAGM